MKLNIFTYGFFPEQFLITEFAAQAARNHETQVLTGLPNYPKGEIFPGYSLMFGPYRESKDAYEILRYPIFPRGQSSLGLLLNYLSHAICSLPSLFRLQKADWAFVFCLSPITIAIPAIIWAKFRGAKTCLWMQDLWPDSAAAVGKLTRESIIYQVIGNLVRWIYKHTDLILIQSPGFEENLKKFGYEGPFYYIPNWAPDVDFANAKTPDWLPEKQSGDPATKFVVTFAGNIGKAQSIDTILAAAAILKSEKQIHFFIVGDGSDLGRSQAIQKEKNLEQVLFLGRRPVQDMPGLFKASDLLLVSLTKDPIFALTIPSKVQAYMAAGRPLVASLDGVGAQIVVESGSGLSAPAEDPKALAEAILKISKMNAEERAQLGSNAKNYFNLNFRKDKITEKIFQLLEKHL